MKAEQTPRQNRRDHVQQFVSEQPPDRPERQLENIDRYGNGKGRYDPAPRQYWRPEFLKESSKHIAPGSIQR